MKKRISALLLTLVMLLTLIPAAVLADDIQSAAATSGSCGEQLTWSVDADNVLTISGTGAMTDYSADNPAPWPTSIEKLVVDSGVTTIGSFAFRNCAVLTEVEIPAGVSIGTAAFKGCSGLTDNDGNVVVNGIYFDYVGGEQDVIIPKRVTEISGYAFAGFQNEGNASVTFYPTLKKVDKDAFISCDNLPRIIMNGKSRDFSGIQIEDYNVAMAKMEYTNRISGEITDETNGALTLAHEVKGHYATTDIPGYQYAMQNYYTMTDGSNEDYYYSAIVLDEEERILVFTEVIDWGNDDVIDAVVTMGIDYTTNTVADSAVYISGDEAASYVDYAEAAIDAASFTADTTLNFTIVPGSGYYDAYYCNYYKEQLNLDYNDAVQLAFEDWEYMFEGMGMYWKFLGFSKYDRYTANPMSGPEHLWDAGTVTEPATCLERGTMTYTCTLDGCTATRTEIIPRTDHTWDSGKLTTPMTAEQDGVITYTCEICGAAKTTVLPAGGSPFIDVQNSDKYYYEPVIWAAENNIVYGTSDFAFSPLSDCTRGQVVTFLYRAAGEPAVTGENPFTDVKESDYFYDAVLWGYNNGIVYGTSETTFAPGAKVTRAQFITFLYRYDQEPAVTDRTSAFVDLPDDAYYTDAVLWGAQNGIVYGTSGTHFSPNANCTRAQVVTFLHRYKTEYLKG